MGSMSKLPKESKTSIRIWPIDILLFVVKDERLTTKTVLKWVWYLYASMPRVPVGKIRHGTGRIVKWASTYIINRFLTTHYYMDTDTYLIVLILTGTHTR